MARSTDNRCPRTQSKGRAPTKARATLLFRAGLVCALVGLGTFVAPGALGAPQQRSSDGAFEVGDSSWEGASDFFALAEGRLGRDRVSVVATLDYSELEPGDGVLILHPDVDVSFDDVTRFLRAGGRVAVADDHGRGDVLLKHFAITRVPAPSRPAATLRGNADLAIATPVLEIVAGAERGRHPIAAHVDEVITNHATGLEHPALTPVLQIDAADAPPVSFAVTGIIGGRGRLLAIGDPSVFINLMLRYPGNRAFAEGVVDYLVANDDWGARGGRLFIVANEFRQTGRYGGGSGLADDALDKLHELRDELATWHDSGLPTHAAWVLAALAGAFAVVWLVSRAARPHQAAPPRFARSTPLVAQGGVIGRAHVLAAGTTAPALALIELKAALHEALAEKLGTRPTETAEKLVELCRGRQLLEQADSDSLMRVARRLREVEQSVTQGASGKIDEREMKELHDETMRLLGALALPEETQKRAGLAKPAKNAELEAHA